MKINIVKGSMNLCIDKSDLKTISQTHDGVVFEFKNGTYLYNTDLNMPLRTKLILTTALANFDGDMINLIFNLLDYNKPVSIKIQ